MIVPIGFAHRSTRDIVWVGHLFCEKKSVFINLTLVTERLLYPCWHNGDGKPVVCWRSPSRFYNMNSGGVGNLGPSAETLSRSLIPKILTLNAGSTKTVNYATTSSVIHLALVEGMSVL